MDLRTRFGLSKELESEKHDRKSIQKLLAKDHYGPVHQELLDITSVFRDDPARRESVIRAVLDAWRLDAPPSQSPLMLIIGDDFDQDPLVNLGSFSLRNSLQRPLEGVGATEDVIRAALRWVLLGDEEALSEVLPLAAEIKTMMRVPWEHPYGSRVMRLNAEGRSDRELIEVVSKDILDGMQPNDARALAALFEGEPSKVPDCRQHPINHIAARPLVRVCHQRVPELFEEKFADWMSALRDPVLIDDGPMTLPPVFALDALPWDEELEVHDGTHHVLGRRCGNVAYVWRWEATTKAVADCSNLGVSEERLSDDESEAAAWLEQEMTQAAAELGTQVQPAWQTRPHEADDLLRLAVLARAGARAYIVAETVRRSGATLPSDVIGQLGNDLRFLADDPRTD